MILYLYSQLRTRIHINSPIELEIETRLVGLLGGARFRRETLHVFGFRRLPERLVERFLGIVQGLVTVHEIDNRRNALWVEVFGDSRVYRYAHATRLRVHAERTLQQVIHVLGHFNIDARVNVPENDLFKVSIQFK